MTNKCAQKKLVKLEIQKNKNTSVAVIQGEARAHIFYKLLIKSYRVTSILTSKNNVVIFVKFFQFVFIWPLKYNKLNHI